MAQDTVKLSIPFTSLVAAISELDIQGKQRLLGMLEEEIGDLEEGAWEKNAGLQAELQQARSEYDKGDFVSLEQYLARASEQN